MKEAIDLFNYPVGEGEGGKEDDGPCDDAEGEEEGGEVDRFGNRLAVVAAAAAAATTATARNNA